MTTKKELNEIIEMASKVEYDFDSIIDVFKGYAFPTWNDGKKLNTTKLLCAKLVKHQAMNFDGSWNQRELDNVCTFLKNKILIVG